MILSWKIYNKQRSSENGDRQRAATLLTRHPHLVSLTVLFILLVVKMACPYTYCEVVGHSMEPAFQDGDIIFLRKTRGEFEIARYDIVVARMKDVSTGAVVKRIVGLPGETIVITDDGRVYVSSQESTEELTDLYDYEQEAIKAEQAIRVSLGNDEYFVMGDNVNFSIDSRGFGPIKIESIFGYKKNE